MSKLTILDKAAVIRNETQPLANTRGRVADVLEDIANTLVDEAALNNEATARAQGDQDNANAINAEATARAQGDQDNANAINAEATARAQGDQDNANAINAEATARAQGDQDNANAIADEATARANGDAMKLDKPNSDGSYYIAKTTVAGIPYYQYRTINLSSGQIPVSMGTYIGASLLYESVSGRIGLDTPNPSEKFEVYNGRVKSDGQVFNETTSAILPKEIKFKDGKFKAALADGVEKAILLEGDVTTTNSFTELTSNSWDGTNKYKILTANTSITLSTELVNGYILLTQDGIGNKIVIINGIYIPINSTAQYSTLVGYAKINGVYYFSINSNLLQQLPIVVSTSFLTFTIKDAQVTGSNGNYSISAGYKFAVSDEFATNEGYVIWENTTTGLVVVGLDVEKTIENFYNPSNVGQWNAFAYFYNGIIYANEIGRTYDQRVNLGSSTGITHLRIRRTATNIVLEKSTDGGTTFTVIHTYIGFTASNLYVKFGTASIAPSTINGLKKLFS